MFATVRFLEENRKALPAIFCGQRFFCAVKNGVLFSRRFERTKNVRKAMRFQ